MQHKPDTASAMYFSWRHLLKDLAAESERCYVSAMKNIVVLVLFAVSAMAYAGEESFRLQDGQVMKYLIEMPASTNPAPLTIVMGGGGGDERQASAAMKKLGRPLTERGWVAVSPVSPQSRSFFNTLEINQIVQLMGHLRRRADINYDKILIGGLSNGGISAISIAQMRPSVFRGVIMTPGLPFNLHTGLDLKALPVYLRIGENDKLRWAESYPRAVKDLKKANARVDSKILAGAGHGFPLDWNEIDAWLKTSAEN